MIEMLVESILMASSFVRARNLKRSGYGAPNDAASESEASRGTHVITPALLAAVLASGLEPPGAVTNEVHSVRTPRHHPTATATGTSPEARASERGSGGRAGTHPTAAGRRAAEAVRGRRRERDRPNARMRSPESGTASTALPLLAARAANAGRCCTGRGMCRAGSRRRRALSVS